MATVIVLISRMRLAAISAARTPLQLHFQPRRQVQRQLAVVQDSFSVQTAGVYQFLLHALILGVSHGTSAVMATETVLTTVMRPAAPT